MGGLLLRADAAAIPLANESVHCVVTSIPYWSLRDYDLPPRIWDGDANCEHSWLDQVKRQTSGSSSDQWSTLGGGQATRKSSATYHKHISNICSNCGAWRGQLGLESTPDLFVEHIVQVFREVRRVLRRDGCCFVNIGDTYSAGGNAGHSKGGDFFHGHNDREGEVRGARKPPPGLKPKDLIGVPWMVAFAMRKDGWYLRSDIIWEKPNCMPQSTNDRPTTSHEYIFLFAKSLRYFFDMDAVKEKASLDTHARYGRAHGSWQPPGQDEHRGIVGPRPNVNQGVNPKARKQEGRNSRMFQDRDPGHSEARKSRQNESFSNAVKDIPEYRNIRSVWSIPTEPFSGSHFATFPQDLVVPCIKSSCPDEVCPQCGAPWVKVIERSGGTIGKSWQAHDNDQVEGNHCEHQDKIHGRNGHKPYRREVVGKKPTCDHYSFLGPFPTVPGIVFDPFGGSGTVSRVAERLGRRWIHADLKYFELSTKRSRNVQKELAL